MDEAKVTGNDEVLAQRNALLAVCKEWLDADSPHTSLEEQRRRWDGIMARMRAAVAAAEGT